MKINFFCDNHILNAIPHPVKAVKAAPEYYKNIKPQISNSPDSSTIKRCVPFLDAMSAGFVIPLWCDMFVTAKDGNININFPKNFAQAETLGSHSIEQLPNHPLVDRPYGKLLLKLINPWVIETSPGTSCLFTSPLNHMESRVKILDGVVDTDTYYNPVNFPFLWTGGDGEFFFEKGTPIVQVIPFKRETLNLQVGVVDTVRKSAASAKLGTHMKHSYRTEFWHAGKASTVRGWRLILDKIRQVKF